MTIIKWYGGWVSKMLPEEAERLALGMRGGTVRDSQIIQRTDEGGNTRIYVVTRVDDPS